MAPAPAGDRVLAPVHTLRTASRPPARLGLTVFDAAPLKALVSGDPGGVAALVEDARELAEALSGPDGDGARVRLLARMAASSRTQQRILEVLMAQTVAQRDEVGFRLVDRALYRVNKQLETTIRELAAEASLRRRPTVTIRNAESVTFEENR